MAAARAASPPPAEPAAAPIQPPVPKADPNTGTILKIVSGFIMFRVALAIVGLAVAGVVWWRVSKSFHLTGEMLSGGSASTDSSVTVTGTEVGADIYPGAEPGPGSFRRVEGAGSITNGVFLTPDPLDKVLDFYRSRLAFGDTSMHSPNGAVLILRRNAQESITVTITQWPSENGGKTKIAILRTKYEAPQ